MFRGFWVAGAVCISHTPMPDLLWPVFKCFIPSSGLSFLLLVIWSRNKWWYLWPAESFLKNNRINIKYTSENNPYPPPLPLPFTQTESSITAAGTWPLGERMGWNKPTRSWLTEMRLLSSLCHCEVFTQKRPLSFNLEAREKGKEKERWYWEVKWGDFKIFTESLKIMKTLWMGSNPMNPTIQILPYSYLETAESSRLNIL